MKARIRDLGILIKATPYSESSLVLRAFTRQHGLIGILAKGIRKKQEQSLPSSGSEYEFSLYEPGEGGLYLMSEFAPVREHDFSAEPQKWSAAECALELYSQLILPVDECPDYYRLLQTWLDYLETLTGAVILVWWRFLLRVFRMLGISWDTACCHSCRQSPVSIAGYEHAAVKLLCSACLKSISAQDGLTTLIPQASQILELLPRIGDYLDTIQPQGETVSQLNDLFARFYEAQFHHPLKLRSLKVLEQFYR